MYSGGGGADDITFNFGGHTNAHTNGSGFVEDDDDDDVHFGRDENRNDGNQISSPSGIKFSFGDEPSPSSRAMMSPIPFARTIGKIGRDDSGTDKFSRFIP